MNAEGFRRIALSMPEAVEAAHGGHPDFRVGKRIFATLGYLDAGFAVVKLTPEQQSMVVAAEPKTSDAELVQCLDRAWHLQAPKRLREAHERPPPKRSARRTA